VRSRAEQTASDVGAGRMRQHRTSPSILFIAAPAFVGGSNRSLLSVLEAIDGSVTRVVAAPSGGQLRALLQERGLTDSYLSLPWASRRFLRSSLIRRGIAVAAAMLIAQWVVRHRKDVTAIHANGLAGLNLAVPAAIMTRRPVVVWVHDAEGSTWGQRLGPVWRTLLPPVRWAAVSSTAVAVLMANGLCGSDDVHIVPNPIAPSDVVGQRRSGRHHLVIGYLGGSTWRKGFDLLPQMIEDLSDLDLEWRLFTDRERTAYNEPVWKRLNGLSGVISCRRQPDVRLVYTQCDIVVVPSRSESFSRITAEAMLNGIPVVATDLPPLQDLLGAGAGLLFPIGDSTAAACAIRQLANDESLRLAAGAQGRRSASTFAPSVIADQLLSLYLSPRESTPYSYRNRASFLEQTE
jgi:glycosyltransferase involved in cell wall biosynthesis